MDKCSFYYFISLEKNTIISHTSTQTAYYPSLDSTLFEANCKFNYSLTRFRIIKLNMISQSEIIIYNKYIKNVV